MLFSHWVEEIWDFACLLGHSSTCSTYAATESVVGSKTYSAPNICIGATVTAGGMVASLSMAMDYVI